MELGDFERSGPWAEAQREGWRLRVLVGDDGGSIDFFVLLDDGRQFTGVAATLDELEELMNRWRFTGECLRGTYLWIRGLIVLRDMDLRALAETVGDLIRTGEIEDALDAIAPDVP